MKTQISSIEAGKIIITGLNHRRKFDKNSLNEMAESIKKHGIINALTVRPSKQKPGQFELVAGERRLKAAEIAELKEIPCIVKDLSDQEFREIMLIENIQREDLNPLDEAKAYQDLLTEDSTIEKVALQTGKSVKHVKQRLSLNNLCAEAKKEYLNGALLLGHAQILALFSKKQQEAAMEKLGNRHDQGRYFNNPIELKSYINRNILLSLSDAPFDIKDAELFSKAGACSNCPKQTNADKDLFNSLSEDAQCMDRECFMKKVDIFQKIQNATLLKRFEMKMVDLPKLYRYWGNEPGYISRDNYTILEEGKSCTSATLGIIETDDRGPIVVMVCINKQCETHRDNTRPIKVSEVPENESVVEGTIRKSKKRRKKENIKDVHSARVDFIQVVGSIETEDPNQFELAYIVKSLMWKSNDNYLSTIAFEMGFLKKEDQSLGWHNRSDFEKFLEKKGKVSLTTFLRKLILLENQNAEDKWIDTRNEKENILLIHGKSHKKTIDKLLKKHQDLRIDPHKVEDEKIKGMIKKEQEKVKKIRDMFLNARYDYHLLERLKRASVEVIAKESVSDLSKMAFRLGLKRKKDGDIAYYAQTIYDGIKTLKDAIKVKDTKPKSAAKRNGNTKKKVKQTVPA